jgi:hypothetical protein
LSIKKTKHDKIKKQPANFTWDLGPFGERGGGFFIEKSNARLGLCDNRGEGHRGSRNLQFVHLRRSENWSNFMTTTQSLISGRSSDRKNLRREGLSVAVFKQDDPPTERQLRHDETGYTGGLWKWPCYEDGFDCLEGQRPRLTHFSTTGGAESLSASTQGN